MSSKPKSSDSKTIEVFLRIRPMIGREIEEKDACKNIVVDPNDKTKITVSQPGRTGVPPKTFNFHQVFPPESSQLEVYERFAKKAVTSALDGYHGVLFVYGQTGSGKSFTISNDTPGNEGMLQRCVADVYDRVNNDTANEYNISVSYVQLYNEILTDLLEDAREVNNHVKLVGVSDINNDLALISERTGEKVGRRARNSEEALEFYRIGSSRKEISKTKMNDTSSRSHCIYSLEISRRPRAGGNNESDPTAPPPRALEGKLILIDLAGSERVAKTGAKDKQLQEATHINGSLLVLGKVVSALTDKNSQHVPFRESKLTRMLQYSLSGYGKTSLVVNVSPSDYNTEETVSSIQFGQRAIQIKESAQQHIILDYKSLYLQLQSQLDKQLETAVESALRDERREHELEVRDLKARIKELEQERDFLRGGETTIKPTGGGGGIGSPNITLPSSVVSGDIAEQFDSLRKVHEENLNSVTSERDMFRQECNDLKQKLSQTESNLFAVAKKFEAYRLTSAVKQQAWLQKMNELAAEVAAVKKCDFLAIDNLDDALNLGSGGGGNSSSSNNASGPGTPAVTPRGSVGFSRSGGSGMSSFAAGASSVLDEEQLEKAYLVIQALQQERQSLIIYQHKAKMAIKLLYSELQEAKRVAGLK